MSDLIEPIIGAKGGGKGGGGGSSHVPTESPDSLRSKQYARVLDLVSEGEIFGLVNGHKSIYFDDTPLQNADGTYNFQDVTIQTRTGTQSQAYIPGFPAAENEVAVGVQVTAATSVTRSITNLNDNAVRVSVSIPQLTYLNPTNGDLSGAAVLIAIDLQTNGGGFVQVVSDTISGKTTSTYQRAYRIPLTGTGPWDIRMRRITADSISSNLVNATWFASYSEIIEQKLRYPNSALVGTQIDAAQFKSVPRRGYEMKGVLVLVPQNYTPATRIYSGTWDGTFKTAWTDNPAWIWYDLVTNHRYGLGEFIQPAQVDKWALYQISKYCDELVPNGFGGTEPRFTCTLYLQTQEEAYTVIQHLASVFRGMVYESAGFLTTVQDAPSDPVAIFTPANVIDGTFNYSGSSIKMRHTVALVTWNDPADRYQQKIEYVEDRDGIARYGIVQTEFVAVGAISRGQAHRAGKWLLFTERMETDTVSFQTGMDGGRCRPGDIIKIADPGVAGIRLGGRVTAGATSSAVPIDSPVTVVGGHTYELSLIMADGNVWAAGLPVALGHRVSAPGLQAYYFECTTPGNTAAASPGWNKTVGGTTADGSAIWTTFAAIESRTITNISGETSVLTVSPAFSRAPDPGGLWVLSDVGAVEPQTYKVISIRESGKNITEVIGISHNPGKYALIEQGIALETPPVTAANLNALAAPGNVVVSSYTYTKSDATIGARLKIAWNAVPGAIYYAVEYKRGNDNWTLVGGNIRETASEAEINYTDTYTARVTAFNLIGTRSPVGQSSATVINWNVLSAPLNLVLAAAYVGKEPQVKWDAVAGAASYVVRVYNGATLVRTVTGWLPTYFGYRLVDSMIDGGPYRAPTIKVSAADSSGTEGTQATLAISNAQIGAPSGLAVIAGMGSITVSTTMPTVEDYAGTKVWVSTTIGFDPAVTTPLYVGPNNYFTAINLAGGVAQYIRVAHYDSFGQDSLTYSTEITATPFAAGGVLTVSALPAATYLGQDVVFYNGDGKLYRWFGASYTRAAAGGDLIAASVTADKMTVTNLAAISASLGTITAGNFTVDAAGFIRGGQTAYNTGAGFWMGYQAAAYQFSIGNGTSYIAYDGTNLNINTPQFSIISGIATFSGALSAASGSFGNVNATGSVTVGTTGNVNAGQSAYDTGNGFFLGYSGGVYKLSIGNSAGNKITWDGSVLLINGAVPGQSIQTQQAYTFAWGKTTTAGYENAQTLGITVGASGNRVVVRCSVVLAANTKRIRLVRDGTVLGEKPNPATIDGLGFTFGSAASEAGFDYVDIPGAGAHTYYLQVLSFNGAAYPVYFSSASITLNEFRA